MSSLPPLKPCFHSPPPLAVYVHTPWCVRKCPYCDFNSHPIRGAVPERAYIDALLADLEQDLPQVTGRGAETVFIGGGTPSLFSPEAIERLLGGLRERLPVAAEAEITLEANPGTVEAGNFGELRAAGVNRLSIGVQSFNPDALQRLGRVHGRREAIRAAECAHEAGFDNLNLDLMYGLPAQSPSQAVEDVATAMDLAPTHISHYQLTIEPGTLFAHRTPALPDEESIWDMQQRCQRALGARGYQRYEVSAYARAGYACRHNLNYWRYGDYLGIGAGAHAKVTDLVRATVTRTWKRKHPSEYLAHARGPDRVGGSVAVRPEELAFEFMMNALRLVEGFTPALFRERTGLALESVEHELGRALAEGLLERDGEALRPTPTGMDFLNDLVARFLPAEPTDAGRGAA
jgi:putative oxygen-independent coproporphyrinogen III oxidase